MKYENHRNFQTALKIFKNNNNCEGLYEDYTNIMGITSSKLLSLSQHGILLTQLNGHYYFHYETDIELSPTDESKWLLNKLSDCGIDIRNKQYGTLEEVLDRFDRLLKWLKESDV